MDNDYSSKIKCILEEEKKHQERCCIVGPIGPQREEDSAGPPGTSVESTYGSKYSSTSETINITANTSQIVPLAISAPMRGITGATANALTISATGVYKIDYYFQGSANMQETVILEVLENGTPISIQVYIKKSKPMLTKVSMAVQLSH